MEPLMTHLAAGKLVQDGQVMQLKGHLQSKMLCMVVIEIFCPRSLPVLLCFQAWSGGSAKVIYSISDNI